MKIRRGPVNSIGLDVCRFQWNFSDSLVRIALFEETPNLQLACMSNMTMSGIVLKLVLGQKNCNKCKTRFTVRTILS